MLKGVLIIVAMAFACAGFPTTASAMPTWEYKLLKRYVNTKPCTGRGAPSWGKAAMARWRATHRNGPSIY